MQEQAASCSIWSPAVSLFDRGMGTDAELPVSVLGVRKYYSKLQITIQRCKINYGISVFNAHTMAPLIQILKAAAEYSCMYLLQQKPMHGIFSCVSDVKADAEEQFD